MRQTDIGIVRMALAALASVVSTLVPACGGDARPERQLAGVASGDPSSDSESQLPEERLLDGYSRGDAARSRVEFEALLVNRRTAADSARTASAPGSRQLLLPYALAVEELGRALNFFCLAEVQYGNNAAVSAAFLTETLVPTWRAYVHHVGTLEQLSAAQPPDASGELATVLAMLRRNAVSRGVQMLAFLRGTAYEAQRGSLLSEAAFLGLPHSDLKSLDAATTDLKATFGIRRGEITAPQPSATRALGVEDPLRRFAEGYVRALLRESKVANLRPYFADGFWPQQDLEAIRTEHAGYEVREVARVDAIAISPTECIVRLSGIVLMGPGGTRSESRDDLVIATESGGFRITRWAAPGEGDGR